MAKWKNANGSLRRVSTTDSSVVYRISDFAKRYTLFKNGRILSIRDTLACCKADAERHDIEMQLARIGLKWVKEIA